MRLRRHPDTAEYDPGPDFYRHLRRLWRAYRRGYTLCQRLTPQAFGDGLDDSQRADALAKARKLIFEINYMKVFVEARLDPEAIFGSDFLPLRFMDAAARVAYALGAMAEPELTPEALLTRAELDGLIEDHDLTAWAETVGDALAEPTP
jgi:hypothetical protein